MAGCSSYQVQSNSPGLQLQTPLQAIPAKYPYVVLGPAKGEHCVGGLFGKPERASVVQAIDKALNPTGADLLANLVTERVTKNYFFIYYRTCDHVYGTAVKMDIPQEKEKVVKRASFMTGKIIAFSENERTIGGSFDEVYIDKGKVNGVWTGDKFAIRKNPESDYRKGEKGREIIGFIKVMSVAENTARAVITNSSEEVTKGDIIESIREQ
jgi:hypothetical protein